MIDKFFGNFNFLVLFEYTYFLLGASLVTFIFIKYFVLKQDDFFDSLKHGNIAVSIIFSSYILSICASTSIIALNNYPALPFVILCFISNLVISLFYYIVRSFFQDYFEEILLNNNIAISILFSAFILSVGIMSGSFF